MASCQRPRHSVAPRASISRPALAVTAAGADHIARASKGMRWEGRGWARTGQQTSAGAFRWLKNNRSQLDLGHLDSLAPELPIPARRLHQTPAPHWLSSTPCSCMRCLSSGDSGGLDCWPARRSLRAACPWARTCEHVGFKTFDTSCHGGDVGQQFDALAGHTASTRSCGISPAASTPECCRIMLASGAGDPGQAKTATAFVRHVHQVPRHDEHLGLRCDSVPAPATRSCIFPGDALRR
jgi:hypothetical protein